MTGQLMSLVTDKFTILDCIVLLIFLAQKWCLGLVLPRYQSIQHGFVVRPGKLKYLSLCLCLHQPMQLGLAGLTPTDFDLRGTAVP